MHELLLRFYRVIRQYPLLTAAVAAMGFIVCVVLAALYANALVWNYATAAGQAVGMGIHVSIIQTLGQYDAQHYAHMAQYGYDAATYAAFLPLFPLLMHSTANITGLPYMWAGLIVSWAALCGATVVVYKWLRLELTAHNVSLSPWIILGVVALFPTSFYMALPYTESLFILLTVGALYAYRKGYYWPATFLAALASLTRYQGIVLSVFFVADFFISKRKLNPRKLLPAFGALFGFGVYLFFLKIHYGTPFEFIIAEKSWNRLSGNLIQNLIFSFRPLYLWFIPVLVAGLWAAWRYLGKAYFLYSLCFILLPLSSGILDSINRYMVSLLPLFLGLTLWAKDKLPQPVVVVYLVSSAFLLAWSIMLFANGYWVA